MTYKAQGDNSVKVKYVILINAKDTMLLKELNNYENYGILINRCLPEIIKFLPRIAFKSNVKIIAFKEFTDGSTFYLDDIFSYLEGFNNIDELYFNGIRSNLQDPILLKDFKHLKIFSANYINFKNDSLLYFLGFCDSLISITINNSNLSKLIIKKNCFSNLKELQIMNTNISKMNYELFCLPKLESLDIRNNKIKKFNKKKVKCKSWGNVRHILKSPVLPN